MQSGAADYPGATFIPMESKAKVLGHPIHPILIVFPLGLLATAVVFDVIHLATGQPRWTEIAFYMIGAGVLGGFAAAMFGWVDWFAIPPGTRAKRIGLLHGVGNVIVLLLFIASWAIRRGGDLANPTMTALVLGFAGAGLALVTGWLGGELVDRLGVGVDDGAHLDSPSSLTDLPASSGRAVAGMGYTGAERRVNTITAYGGVERRTLARR
jgi:uncharacterized membrane protein